MQLFQQFSVLTPEENKYQTAHILHKVEPGNPEGETEFPKFSFFG
jgi:hypothetical protein